jgi:prevent-host-death family protein
VYARLVSVTVGVRKLRESLSYYLDLAKNGGEVVITERGKRVARIVGPSKLDQLVNEGRVRPAKRPKTPIRPEDLIAIDGPPYLSDIVIEDRKRERG